MAGTANNAVAAKRPALMEFIRFTPMPVLSAGS